MGNHSIDYRNEPEENCCACAENEGSAGHPDRSHRYSATKDITAALNGLLADVFALYLKTKNFHWHVSGPHFRDYHLLLDEHADQIFAMTDPLAERARKIGGTTLRSIGQISRTQRILDNDADYVEPLDMLAELQEDNQALTTRLPGGARCLRRARRHCDGEFD